MINSCPPAFTQAGRSPAPYLQKHPAVISSWCKLLVAASHPCSRANERCGALLHLRKKMRRKSVLHPRVELESIPATYKSSPSSREWGLRSPHPSSQECPTLE